MLAFSAIAASRPGLWPSRESGRMMPPSPLAGRHAAAPTCVKGRAVPDSPPEALLRRAQAGDKSAFERLIAPHLDRCYAIAYQVTHSQDDAADVVQEAMIKAYRSLSTFRAEAGLSAWLGRIVRNAALDEMKRAVRKHEEATEILPESGGPGLEGKLERQELQQIMGEAIATLSDKLRDPLVLFDIEGFTYEEIAALLELNLGTVKSRLNRAREALRQRLVTQRARLAGYLSERMGD